MRNFSRAILPQVPSRQPASASTTTTISSTRSTLRQSIVKWRGSSPSSSGSGSESLFSFEELREYEWNPMVYTGALGNSIANLIYQEFAPLDQRLKNAAARAAHVPGFLDQAKAVLKNAPAMHVETAINQNKGDVGLFKDELMKAAKGLPPDLQAEVGAASAKAVAALEEFGKWLEKDLKPRATKDEHLGKALFEKKLTFALKSNLTPEQVLRRAESEKARVHAEMYALAAPLYKEYYSEDVAGKD
ncbi:MAG: DUF885 domain-containing protein, partial [Ignavibacteria bacterium]